MKVVYCGPTGSGKATNLMQVHRLLEPHCCSRLNALNTGNDRTIYFDISPPVRAPGYRVKLRLLAVVGDASQTSTHRVVMAGTDGLIFVADSQREREEANEQAWEQMLQTARATGADTGSMPIVVQFNKHDLPNARSEAELTATRRTRAEPMFLASAVRGEGVLETLNGLLDVLLDQLDERYNFQAKFNLSSEDFLNDVFAGPMRR